eukprot:GHVT01028621.1.p1 GENE.GHVT01028621.1~~GHVT01028621.1.p1  ORF type:complete len:244 (+),score=39.81 GHVT01028621.1:114-845(+)
MFLNKIPACFSSHFIALCAWGSAWQLRATQMAEIKKLVDPSNDDALQKAARNFLTAVRRPGINQREAADVQPLKVSFHDDTVEFNVGDTQKSAKLDFSHALRLLNNKCSFALEAEEMVATMGAAAAIHSEGVYELDMNLSTVGKVQYFVASVKEPTTVLELPGEILDHCYEQNDYRFVTKWIEDMVALTNTPEKRHRAGRTRGSFQTANRPFVSLKLELGIGLSGSAQIYDLDFFQCSAFCNS